MTQTEMVLVYMARHGSITQYQASGKTAQVACYSIGGEEHGKNI